jgi:hypothetical protein
MLRALVLCMSFAIPVLVVGCGGGNEAATPLPVSGVWEGVSQDGRQHVMARFMADGQYQFEILDPQAERGLLYSHGGSWEMQGDPAAPEPTVTITPQRDYSGAAKSIEKQPFELTFRPAPGAAPAPAAAPAAADGENAADEGEAAAADGPDRWIVQTPWGEFLLYRPVQA